MIDWSKLENGQLTSESVNLTVSGNYSLVQGVEDTAIRLEEAFIEMTPNKQSCILNLNSCAKSGFTLRLRLRFLELIKDTYFVSSGVEVTKKQGFAFFYEHRFQRFRVTAATQTEAWYITLSKSLVEYEWYTLDFTWSLTAGLEVFVNDVSCGSASVAVTLTEEKTEVTETVFIARKTEETTEISYAKLEVEEVATFTAERSDLILSGIFPKGTRNVQRLLNV